MAPVSFGTCQRKEDAAAVWVIEDFVTCGGATSGPRLPTFAKCHRPVMGRLTRG
jgi:hypothetical protein